MSILWITILFKLYKYPRLLGQPNTSIPELRQYNQRLITETFGSEFWSSLTNQPAYWVTWANSSLSLFSRRETFGGSFFIVPSSSKILWFFFITNKITYLIVWVIISYINLYRSRAEQVHKHTKLPFTPGPLHMWFPLYQKGFLCSTLLIHQCFSTWRSSPTSPNFYHPPNLHNLDFSTKASSTHTIWSLFQLSLKKKLSYLSSSTNTLIENNYRSSFKDF